MTRDEAKRTLSLFRPGTSDAQSPEFAEALALARADAELGRWFELHCARYSAIRSAFQKISPPEAFKEQIISEHRARLQSAKQRRSVLIAASLVVVILLGFSAGWLIQSHRFATETNFAAYRSRMVKTALRAYDMDLETNSAPAIRAYLAEHQANANYVLPRQLLDAANTGCGVLKWQGQPVAMVCFRSGRPLPPGEKTDLFLFVMNQRIAPDAPKSGQLQFAQVNKLTTVSWTKDGLVYLLAAPGDEEFLKKYL